LPVFPLFHPSSPFSLFRDDPDLVRRDVVTGFLTVLWKEPFQVISFSRSFFFFVTTFLLCLAAFFSGHPWRTSFGSFVLLPVPQFSPRADLFRFSDGFLTFLSYFSTAKTWTDVPSRPPVIHCIETFFLHSSGAGSAA